MAITLTERAAQEVKRIIQDQKMGEDTLLRVGVAGGGCSGFTYKLAFESGKGQDYGLASAISIAIFFVVAGISWISFSRTKSLENLA